MKQEQAKEQSKNESLNDRVKQSVKVAGSKVLLEVLRIENSGLIILSDQQKNYETFFPIILKGEQVHTFEVGDFVAVKPNVDFPLIFLYGKEYMLCNLFEIEYGVSPSYPALHKQYEEERKAKEMLKLDSETTLKKGAKLFSTSNIPDPKAPVYIDKTKYK